MKKWIIGVIVFAILIVVGYCVYLFVFVPNDRDKCMQYSLDHPYVRCSYNNRNGKTQYCRRKINCCEDCNCPRYKEICVDKIYKLYN